MRNTVKLFIDKEREKEEKTADLKKQLEEKEAEHTARSAKVNAINGKIADIKAAFKSESSLYINGESHAKNLFTPVKEFFIKNYPVEVQNHQMTIDDNLLKCTGKGMTEKVNAIEKAAERFSEFKSKELNKNASKEDVIKGKVDALLDVYKNNGKSFDERKMCLKAVLDRKNDLQSNLDGRNFFAKMFSAIVPNSWTEIGRLKNEINTLNNTIESVVSEQDIKDMYTDPIDEPRDPAKAEKLQPVFDYVKIVMDYAKAKGPVYDNIKKDIELMEGGVFAKGDKKCLDSLSDDLNIFLIDGKFEEELNVDDKRSFNAQVFNAFEAIKNFKENGVLEIKDVLSEMQNPEDTNELVEDLKDKTVGDKENRLSEATVDKSNEVKLDLNKTN